MILCGAMVFSMQAGFAMVEAGTCRVRSVQNVLMKNLVDVCVGTLCWWAIGWSIAYGTGEPTPFASSSEFFSIGFTTANDDGVITPSDQMRNWFFQWTFCSG